MKTRILAALPIAAILIAAIIIQGYFLFGLVVVLSFIAQKEILGAVSAKGDKAIGIIPYILCAVIPVTMFLNTTVTLYLIIVSYVVALMALFMIAMFSKKYDYKCLRNSIVALVYPQLLFVFVYLLVVHHIGFDFFSANPFVLLLAILAPIFCDCLAYFVGKGLGKRKLCPEISPKKTVAGLVGGILGGALAGFLVWLFFASGIIGFYYDMNVFAAIGICAVVAFISQLGDLSASYIKRHYGIKDFGSLIPGHGGILDRMDSILFAVPVVYMLISLIAVF